MAPDLTCANCQNFNRAACNQPRCLSHFNIYAQSDSPACAHFERVTDQVLIFSFLKATKNLDDQRRRSSDAQA